MRKAFLSWLLLAAVCIVYGQGKTLYQVNVAKPKPGMASSFEETWKEHLAKFHSGTDKRMVYQVESGTENGSYVIVEGPISYADMDVVLPTSKEHSMDMEKNFTPKLEPMVENLLVRWADTLSYRSDVKADLFLLTATVLKDGKLAEYTAESRRVILLYQKLNAPFSFNTMIKQQAGSSPTIIQIRRLKDGYKELDSDYFHLSPDWFHDAYVKEYGQAAWDNRTKLMTEDVVVRTQRFEKFRADLSSK